MALNSRHRDQPNASRQLKRAGGVVTGLSGVALLWAVIGLVVDQEKLLAVLLVCMSLWGLATGVGLLRVQPWSRLSMLVFHSLLSICAVSSLVLLVVLGLTTPNKGKKGGKVVTTGRIVVSADGKTRTVGTSGTDSMGRMMKSIAVYDKQ